MILSDPSPPIVLSFDVRISLDLRSDALSNVPSENTTGFTLTMFVALGVLSSGSSFGLSLSY